MTSAPTTHPAPSTPLGAPRSERFLCLSHPDFHMPDAVTIGEGFDADAYVARLKEAGVDAVAQFASCHYGNCYYPTAIGTPHPGLTRDMLGEVSAACRRHGLGIVAYHSVFLATAVVQRHPDWRFQSTDTGSDAGFDSKGFDRLCVNTPFLEEYFLPICRETAAHCELDELFLDTMCGFQPCYCRHCVKAFGGPIPSGPEDPSWLRYVAFYRQRHEAFFARVVEELAVEFPELVVSFNWTWSYRQGTTAPPEVGRLAADLIPTPQVASDACRYFAGQDKPYVYMTGRFHNGLGDWCNLEPETMRITAAATVANGGSFYLIDRQLPDGSLEDRAFDAYASVFPWLQERREWLLGARPLRRVAALWDDATINGPDNRYFPHRDLRRERQWRYEGVGRVLRDHGRHFVACGGERLPDLFDGLEVLLLPEPSGLDPALVEAIGDWVRAGGRLLLSLPPEEDELDPKLLDLAGVAHAGRSQHDYHYVALAEFESMRTPLWHLEPQAGTTTLIGTGAVMPTGGKFGHGLAPPVGRDRHPWATERGLGDGVVRCIAAPIFSHLRRWPHPRQERALIELIDGLDPTPPARLETPAQVELGCTRIGEDLIVHLVNHSGREDLGGYYFPTTAYLPPIRDVQVHLHAPGGRELRVERLPDQTPVEFARDGDRLRFTADELIDLGSYRVAGYFEEG